MTQLKKNRSNNRQRYRHCDKKLARLLFDFGVIPHFLLTLETVVFLFHLLSTTSKPFSSLSTRLAHAARLGFFYKKTRYINSLLLLLPVANATDDDC